MRFELLLLLSLTVFVSAQDDLIEIGEDPSGSDPAPVASEPEAAAPIAAGDVGAAGFGAFRKKCSVSKQYYDYKRSGFHEGSCKSLSDSDALGFDKWICDTRYGTKHGKGYCRPKKSCSVRFQDCKNKKKYCSQFPLGFDLSETTALSATSGLDNIFTKYTPDLVLPLFWGECIPKVKNNSICFDDAVCKSGYCQDFKDLLIFVGVCKRKPNGFKGGYNNNSQNYQSYD